MSIETTSKSQVEYSKESSAWADRCKFWQRQNRKSLIRASKRAPASPALVLAGHGVSFRIHGGALAIRDGLTHHPQNRETYLFFPNDPDLPKRIILLDGSGSVSFEVLSWLMEQDVSLIRIDWRGNFVCVASRSGYAANPYRVGWQQQTRNDENKRVEFSIELIAQKINNSISTLEKSVRRNAAWTKALKVAYATLTRFDKYSPKSISELRVLEANAAAAYFRAWKGIPISWQQSSKRPIPNSWHEIEQRSSLNLKVGNRNASHPVNAILNYAYTVLQTELQIHAITEGYDPAIGIMHEARENSSAFLFDLMEPQRPIVDWVVLEFVKSTRFHPADFTIRSDGVCRLNSEMARMIVEMVASSCADKRALASNFCEILKFN